MAMFETISQKIVHAKVQQVWSLNLWGLAFLARVFVTCEMPYLYKTCCSGSAFLAGAFVFWKEHDLKNMIFLVGGPSRGFCFFGKTCPQRTLVFGVGVPGKVFFLIRKIKEN